MSIAGSVKFYKSVSNLRVMGVDPGIASTGYGVVETEGKRIIHISSGCIKTPSSRELPGRLFEIFKSLQEVILKDKPDAVAIESLFFSSNAKTAMAVGQAKGVSMLAAATLDKAVFEYTPLEVKMAIVGYGRASKEQVLKMVNTIASCDIRNEHAADALAVAICHINSRGKY